MQAIASLFVSARGGLQRSWIPRAAACALLLAAAPRGATAQQAGEKPVPKPTEAGNSQNHDTAGIVEEQDLLRRQLQRLRRTMESLIPRLEKEGRPRALELLKDGLKLLEERGEDTKRLTIEELMDSARQGVQSGQLTNREVSNLEKGQAHSASA